MGEPRLPNLAALKKKFEDFDLGEVYDKAKAAALDPEAQNFVVLFGPQHAKIALDLGLDDFRDLQNWNNDEDYPIRWINFWNTTKQEDVIDHIGQDYGFTRRLRASITAWDKYRRIVKDQSAKEKKEKKKQSEPENIHSTVIRKEDIEQGLNGVLNGVPDKHARSHAIAIQPRPDLEELSYFRLVQSSMNYITVDHGERFTCIGANWLHLRSEHDKQLVPPKHWAWLTLCSTSGKCTDTVISIHEEPNLEEPNLAGPPEDAKVAVERRLKELAFMRYNTVAVLKQLSLIGIARTKDSALSLKAIREPLGRESSPRIRSSTAVPKERIAEVGSSNLFYYLFEDTLAVVPVLSSSKVALEHLTKRILRSARIKEKKTAQSDIIPELHKLGKDLRLLQHLFKSYKTLIQTILTPPDTDVSERIKLDQQARDRFRRLGDRLQLLMLNTIKEYLNEKSELSSTYFNLTAQKDSQATAQLTQSATLLAKLSVLFLPISFVTSYFSIEIPGLMDSYTPKTYWVCFGVVAAISFLCLFFFARLLMVVSDRLDAASEQLAQRVKRTLSNHKHKHKHDDDSDDHDD